MDSDHKKIRVGIMLDTYHMEYWAYKILEEISSSDYASVELIILNAKLDVKISTVDKIRINRKEIFYIAYTKLEKRIIQPKPDAFTRINAQKILENVPVIVTLPKMDKYSDWIETDDIEKIKKFDLDVIIQSGFRVLKGDILNVAKYGIWSYYHDDDTVIRGGPPGFWETFERMGERGAILEMLTKDEDNGIELYRSFFPIYSLFLSENNNSCYLRSSLFIPRILKKIYYQGENTLFAHEERDSKKLFFYNNENYITPTNLKFLKMGIKHFFRMSAEILHRQFVQSQWLLMFDLHDDLSTSFWRFKKITPPKDRFWADPQVYFKDETYYIFIEELIFKKKKGHISLFEMNQSGKYSDPVKVLEEPFHLSYPHVFENNGTLWMIPETRQAHSINLYQCTDFPTGWKHRATLMDSVEAVDSTILFSKNKWWLFTNIAEPKGTAIDNELYLFYSDNLVTQHWNSHPMNPVISDGKRARPAGKIFERNGKYYRPSQCSKPSYGYGIKINEIVVLTENEYQEKEVAFIEPKWDKKLKGIHTICYENRLTMIDGAYDKFVV